MVPTHTPAPKHSAECLARRLVDAIYVGESDIVAATKAELAARSIDELEAAQRRLEAGEEWEESGEIEGILDRITDS